MCFGLEFTLALKVSLKSADKKIVLESSLTSSYILL